VLIVSSFFGGPVLCDCCRRQHFFFRRFLVVSFFFIWTTPRDGSAFSTLSLQHSLLPDSPDYSPPFHPLFRVPTLSLTQKNLHWRPPPTPANSLSDLGKPAVYGPDRSLKADSLPYSSSSYRSSFFVPGPLLSKLY